MERRPVMSVSKRRVVPGVHSLVSENDASKKTHLHWPAPVRIHSFLVQTTNRSLSPRLHWHAVWIAPKDTVVVVDMKKAHTRNTTPKEDIAKRVSNRKAIDNRVIVNSTATIDKLRRVWTMAATKKVERSSKFIRKELASNYDWVSFIAMLSYKHGNWVLFQLFYMNFETLQMNHIIFRFSTLKLKTTQLICTTLWICPNLWKMTKRIYRNWAISYRKKCEVSQITSIWASVHLSTRCWCHTCQQCQRSKLLFHSNMHYYFQNWSNFVLDRRLFNQIELICIFNYLL